MMSSFLAVVAGCGDFGTSGSSGDVASRVYGLDGGASVFAFGTGTIGDPYGIDTCARLQAMKDYVTSHFVLADDIECAGFDYANDGKGFLPVGTQQAPFTGSLDGAEHLIRDLTIHRPTADRVGLFGTTGDAALHDFGFEDVEVEGYGYVGALVGRGTATIERVFVKGRVSASHSVGALAGLFSGVVTNVYTQADVTARDSWLDGLLIGYANYVTATYVYATGALLRGSTPTPEPEAQIYGFDFIPSDSITYAFTDVENCLYYGMSYGVCKTTEEMQTLETYTAEPGCFYLPDLEWVCLDPSITEPWDFETTWGFPATTPSYPCLLWEEGCVPQ